MVSLPPTLRIHVHRLETFSAARNMPTFVGSNKCLSFLYMIPVGFPVLCTGGPDVIRKEAWPSYRTISGVRLSWELEEPTEPKRTA